jgi:hypothetical protein
MSAKKKYKPPFELAGVEVEKIRTNNGGQLGEFYLWYESFTARWYTISPTTHGREWESFEAAIQYLEEQVG